MADQQIRNEYGEVVHARLSQPTARSSAARGESPRQIADRFLRRHMADFGFGESRLATESAAEGTPGADVTAPHVHFRQEKPLPGSTVVVYEQTVLGLPVFGARIGVHVDTTAGVVTSVQSSLHGHIAVENPTQKTGRADGEKALDAATLRGLGIDLEGLEEVRKHRQVVHRFEPNQRTGDDGGGESFGGSPPTPTLPPLPDHFAKGQHYVVDEILFRASPGAGQPPASWRALVEPESGAVVYLRALLADAT